MAVLSTQDRQRVWRGVMRYWSGPDTRETYPTKKVALQATINAIDDALEAAAPGINTAIPLPTRTELSLQQKGLLVAVVALARTGNIGLIRRILGEVD